MLRRPSWWSFCLISLAFLSGAPGAENAGPAEGEGQDDAVSWKQLTAGKTKIQFYGFLRSDLILDDSRPDSFQSPLFILAEDPNVGPAGQSNFTLHPRLTRLGINYKGGEIQGLGGARASGNLELDFQNGGRESRPIIRIRHAYFKMTWNAVSLLAGQTWDVISPLFPTVNNDTLMWNAGNIGDRRPQMRLTYEPKVGSGILAVAGAAGLTGAVDSQDLDADGVRDGEASGRPNVQGRLGYSRPLSGDRKLSFGVSGHYAWQETLTPVAGRDTYRSRSLGVDYRIPVHKRFALQGEAWSGRNLGDFRGGVGQSVNTALGEEIASRGGWLEAAVTIARPWTIYPGVSIDDPVDEDVPAAGRVKNRTWYVSNRYQPDPAFLAGIDFIRWVTDFNGLKDGTDDRINVYVLYSY